MGPKHRDVISDIARIRRSGAYVDHANTAASRLNQMKSGHLRQGVRGSVRRTLLAQSRFGRDDVAGFNKGIGQWIAGRHSLAADARECVDIELVVGKDHKILEVLRIGSSVVI